MNRLSVIHIGVGGFGRLWLEHIRDLPSIQIVALVDVVQDHISDARKILDNDSIPVFDSHTTAFREIEADLVILVTPPPTRYQQTKAALDAGLHVLMEKPLASDYPAALALWQLSRQYPQIVAVNQNYRWSAYVQAMKTALESGAIGRVAMVEWQFARNIMTSSANHTSWRKDRPEPLLTEMSIHHFDLMRYLFGDQPRSVVAKSFNPAWNSHKGNTSAFAIFDFGNGIHINYTATTVNRGKDTTWTGNIRIIGETGALLLRDDVAYLISPDGAEQSLPLPTPQYATVDYTVYDLVEAIKANRPPATPIADNIVSFAMVGGAIESSNSGVSVRLDTGYYNPRETLAT